MPSQLFGFGVNPKAAQAAKDCVSEVWVPGSDGQEREREREGEREREREREREKNRGRGGERFCKTRAMHLERSQRQMWMELLRKNESGVCLASEETVNVPRGALHLADGGPQLFHHVLRERLRPLCQVAFTWERRPLGLSASPPLLLGLNEEGRERPGNMESHFPAN